MPKVKLNSGMVWNGSPVSAGESIECTEREALSLIQRGKGVRIIENVVIVQEAIEKPEPKKRGRKPKLKED